MITAAFVTVGPALSTKVNFQFLSKTNTTRIFLMTLVKQSVLRNSKLGFLIQVPQLALCPVVFKYM